MNGNDLQQPQVIIIGAGAAGLFCAGILSQAKITSLILEKNKTPGKKLLFQEEDVVTLLTQTLTNSISKAKAKTFTGKFYNNIKIRILLIL